MKGDFQSQILYQADFFRQWQRVDDGSIDLAICDPPYNILERVHAWDKKIDFAVLSWILCQLLKPAGQIALFCSAKMIAKIETALANYFEMRYIDIWQKPSAMALHKDRPKPDVEFVCVFHRRGTKKKDRTFNWKDVAHHGQPYVRENKNRNHTNLATTKRAADINASGLRYPSSVVNFPNRPAMTSDEKRYAKHDTQKSLDHMKYLIRLLCDEGATVLDPFMGSGSTILAAAQTGRKVIGFDIIEKYFDMTKTRLKRETAQGVLA